MSQRFAASMRGVMLAGATVMGLGLLQGCASPPRLTAEAPETRTFVSLGEMGRIKFGMSIGATERALGTPLNVADLDNRHDYLVKVTDENKQVRFIPYGVFFKNGSVVKVEAIDK